MKYVVIGNSTAGASAVEAIRSVDTKGRITVVSDEPYHTYSRPLISYWLAGKVDDKRMFYKGESHLKDLEVTEIFGKKAVKIDAKKKAVLLEDGKRLPYDKLLIATGGAPITPPIKSGALPGVFSFMNWDNARKVREYLAKHKVRQVVVVGGGLIGLKVTEALVELGLKVTVLELSDRVLSATFDRKASDVMVSYLKIKGVDVITGNTVEEIVGEHERVAGVVLKDGKKIACGMVVLAVGVRPNIGLTEGTGIKTGRGILVDSRMRTSVEDVYAAGDVAEAHDTIINAPRTIAIWPLAVRQGRVAGLNMAGKSAEYPGGFPMNSVEIHGLPTISLGLTDPKNDGYTILSEYKPKEFLYRKVVLEGGKLKGIIFVGKIDRAGLFTSIIDTGIDINKIKDRLLDDSFGLIALPADYRKHAVKGPEMDV
ncbi:MAG: FAD-dependent oxidoreductase [Candidatus Altiarchaeota archaeon]|nr:FAD-dependent oxidoreductase [Candidatus Altiarchaeota archaeon]